MKNRLIKQKEPVLRGQALSRHGVSFLVCFYDSINSMLCGIEFLLIANSVRSGGRTC